MIQVTAASSPACQLYEATGPDASRVIDSLKAGCVNQGSITAKVADACPSESNLGGCKKAVPVAGGANVQLVLTNFYYSTANDAAPFPAPSTAAAVKQLCSYDSSAYIASP